jgi:hypothetical protein
MRAIDASPNGLTVTGIDKREENGIRTIHRDPDALQATGFSLYTKRVERSNRSVFTSIFKFHFPQKLWKLTWQHETPKPITGYSAFLRPGMNKNRAIPKLRKIKVIDFNLVPISTQRASFPGIQLNSTDRFHGSPR